MNVLKILSITIAAAAFPGTLLAETWNGSVNSDWATSGNWVGGNVPHAGSTTTVEINNSTGAMPVIDGIDAAAHSVTVGRSTGITASLTIQNGGTLTTNQQSYIGGIFNATALATGHVLVTGTDSLWTSNHSILVGLMNGSVGSTLSIRDHAVANVSGTLMIASGGGASLTVDGGGTIKGLAAFIIGNEATGHGTANISGAGSSITSNGNIFVANAGTGTLTLQAGAVLTGSAGMTIGNGANGTGEVSVSGSGSNINVAGTMTVGNHGKASLALSNSSTATMGALTVAGGNATAKGEISVLSGASLTVTGVATLRGGNTANEITIDGGTLTTGSNFTIGNTNGGTSNVVIKNGGKLTTGANSILTIGDLAGSTGGVTVEGSTSTLNAYSIRVANSGTGALTIADGATVTVGAGNVTLANSANGYGVLTIGKGAGAGILDAASITSSQAGAKLVFNHYDSAYNFNARITGSVGVEVNGTGETILNSASANTYTGGTVVNSGTLRIKSSANNWLAATGNIRLSGGELNLGGNSLALSSGELRLDGGRLTSGTLNKSSGNIDGRSGMVSAVLAGNAGLLKTTSGTLSLSAQNTYTGATTISAGSLLVLNGGSLSASSHVTVQTGGTLGGNGVIHGNVTLDGGTLDVGFNTGAFTIGGNLVLNSGVTIVDLESSIVFDSLQGIQALTYGGTLQVNIASGIESETFKLFTFSTRSGVSEFSQIILSSGYVGTFDYSTGELTVNAVPEPGHLALLGLLAGGIGRFIRRRRLANVD